MLNDVIYDHCVIICDRYAKFPFSEARVPVLSIHNPKCLTMSQNINQTLVQHASNSVLAMTGCPFVSFAKITVTGCFACMETPSSRVNASPCKTVECESTVMSLTELTDPSESLTFKKAT